jgi:hypothetical protein
MNFLNWSAYGLAPFLTVFWRSLINALCGVRAGLAVAGMMGGIKIYLK